MRQSVRDWLSDNRFGVAILGAIAGVFILSACVGGKAVNDYVRVERPLPVVRALGGERSVSLTEARVDLEAFYRWANDWGAIYAERVGRSEEWAALLSSFGNLAIEQGLPLLAGVPMGGGIAMLLAGAGGLYLRKPGDGTKIIALEERIAALQQTMREKEESFNAGLERGRGSA